VPRFTRFQTEAPRKADRRPGDFRGRDTPDFSSASYSVPYFLPCFNRCQIMITSDRRFVGRPLWSRVQVSGDVEAVENARSPQSKRGLRRVVLKWKR